MGAETLLFLGYTEAEPGQGLCDDDDDVSAVIRAERVIITEEAEEAKEESQDTQAVEEKAEVEEREEEREEEQKKREEKEEERQQEQEEENEEERENEREKEEENEVEKREDELADVEDNLIMSTVVTEPEEGLRHENEELKRDLLNNTTVKIIKQTDKEMSANTDADANVVKDLISALNTDLTSDADPDVAVGEQEGAVAKTHTWFLSETPGGALQTPGALSALPPSAQNPNGAQKSPGPAASFTNTAAQFQEIPLDGGMVEEEPLLATRVEPLTDASNPKQAERANTKTCQCCSVM